VKRFILLAIVSVAFTASVAAAQQSVFVVRHAERADGGAGVPATGTARPDPDLSDAGKARAESLAAALKHIQITAIFVTEFKRTVQTAEPTARALGIQPTVVAASDPTALLDRINAATGNVLVVGHSNTVPDILGRLGVKTTVKLEDADYDNLFIVVRRDEPVLLRLHFR
jgi:broad specificity phosphatase PhoE